VEREVEMQGVVGCALIVRPDDADVARTTSSAARVLHE
jgi:hypothetical protein